MNSNGQVVGTATTASGVSHAFSWTAVGGMVDIGSLCTTNLSYGYSSAAAVNANGQVVGRSGNCGADPGNYGDRGFSWTQAGGLVDMDALPPGDGSSAGAINDNGQAVGSSVNGYGYGQAISWTQAGGLVDLGTLGGSSDDGSGATAINDSGQVVGASYTSTSPPNNGVYHAFVWTQSGGMVDLGTLPGDSFSSAVAINNNGEIAGADFASSGMALRAVLWAAPSATGPPVNTSRPTISGTPQAGQVLTCSPGTWSNSPTGFAYQWQQDGSDITGATDSSYTVQPTDAGHSLACAVTATNRAGSAAATSAPLVISSPSTGPCLANGATPTICSVTPVAGPLDGGTHITVTGAGFLPGDQLCFYIALDVNAGVCASQATVVSPTKIDAVTPSEDYPTGGIGVYYLGVERCCSGLQTSIYHSNVSFTFFPPPPPPRPAPGGCDVFSIGPTACWRVGAGATADWFTSEISSTFGPARNPDFIVASLTGGAGYSRGPSGAFSAIITCSGDIFVEPSIGYSFVGGGIPLGASSLNVLNIGAVLAAGYVGTPGNPLGTYSWRQVDGFVQGATADVSVGLGSGMAFMVSPTAPGPKTGIEYWQGTVGQIAVSGGLGFWLAGPDPHADSNKACGDILNTTTWRTLTSRGPAVGLAAGKSVAIYLACPASDACTGTTALTGATRSTALAARARRGNRNAGELGGVEFTIRPYSSQWVVIPLRKSAQRRLAASRGRLTAMLTLDENIAGHPLHSSETVALQRTPNLSRVAQKARKWREPGRGVHGVPAGTIFSFTLNQPAHVTMTFSERSQSHRVNAGQLSISGRAGTNRIRFRGAIVPKLRLAPGTYRVIITATNAAGQRSKPHQLTFRILR